MKWLSFLAAILLASTVSAQQRSFESLLGSAPVGEVSQNPEVQVPYITWGGDVATFVANGGLQTKPGTLFANQGLRIKLVAGDDPKQQVRDYMTGKSPFIRVTYEMAALASEVMNKDPRTKPIMILQLTWSLGDHIVFREADNNLRVDGAGGIEPIRATQLQQWKGRAKKVKVCLQELGPHVGLVNDSLTAAGLTWDDIEVVWAKDLTASNNSPAEMFRRDPTIDACCVITPDMIGLTSGLDAVGSGAEKTVKGARVINSTSTMDRSIADMYVCRNDWYTAHKDWVQKFVVGYHQSVEQLMKNKEAYNNGRGNSPAYVAALQLAQQIYTKEVLPTIEEDAHGLVSDANFARIPGNEIFFNDPNNLTGFLAKQKSALALAAKLGYIRNQIGFQKADWDYRQISQLVGVNYVPPVYNQGRVKAEVADFSEDLDSNTVLSFEIKFDPEQTEFPIERYRGDFLHFCENASKFSRAAILIEGHSDPTLALQHFFWAAQAKGLVTGSAPNYKFKGQNLDLTNTDSVIASIQAENLAGQKRTNRNGVQEEVPDPKATVGAALRLSQDRAEAVKTAVTQFVKDGKYQISMEAVIPHGVGIAQPVNPRPRDINQAKENMRVVFRVVRLKAEAIKAEDFDFAN
jgi:ABC-type nitrate/sulfonate/bicarbonate transport system substrate-binding protein